MHGRKQSVHKDKISLGHPRGTGWNTAQKLSVRLACLQTHQKKEYSEQEKSQNQLAVSDTAWIRSPPVCRLEAEAGGVSRSISDDAGTWVSFISSLPNRG